MSKLLYSHPTFIPLKKCHSGFSPKSLSHLSLAWLLFAFSLFGTCNGNASPWVEPGDERTRHHLQNLVDSGLSSTLVTAWPLMWSNIKSGLNKLDPAKLNRSELWSYQYLKHEFRQAIKPVNTEQTAYLSNAAPSIRSFGSDAKEEREVTFALNYTGDNNAFKLKATYAKYALDGKTTRYDGSHFTHLFNNWAIGVGAIDRWWGPGWESSLILSNNARPAPSIYLQRNGSHTFQTPWLSWIGPWQLTTFMSQLESDRYTPNALLWGMRVNFRPVKSLEIGLSRTAMWGGEGRPQDLDTFFDLLIGRDNYDSDDDKSKEPGNQMAGIDLRWSTRLKSVNMALYGQLIGEDEAGGMPSRHIGMAGIELNTLIWDMQARTSFEGKNTTVYFYESDKVAPNTAYEHPLYQNGYRYQGQPMGASADNDTESFTLRGQLFFRNGHHASMAISKHNINMDGTNRVAPGGSIYGDGQTQTYQTQISYSLPFSEHLMVKTGLYYFTNTIAVHEQPISNGAFIQLNTRW